MVINTKFLYLPAVSSLIPGMGLVRYRMRLFQTHQRGKNIANFPMLCVMNVLHQPEDRVDHTINEAFVLWGLLS